MALGTVVSSATALIVAGGGSGGNAGGSSASGAGGGSLSPFLLWECVLQQHSPLKRSFTILHALCPPPILMWLGM